MRITPVSMTYARHNSRPQNFRLQNQNVKFEGFFDRFKKQKEEDKPLTEEEIKKIMGLYANPPISREELRKKMAEYDEKVKSGEIVPKETEREIDEDYKDNLEKSWDLFGTRN